MGSELYENLRKAGYELRETQSKLKETETKKREIDKEYETLLSKCDRDATLIYNIINNTYPKPKFPLLLILDQTNALMITEPEYTVSIVQYY